MRKISDSLQVVKRNLICETCDFPKEFEIDKYEIFSGNPTRALHDEEMIDLGNRQVMVIHTPGHLPGHHQLDIPVGIIEEIEKAFASLDKAGKLVQGQGVFDFGEFQIHI
ncbi:hypothetical protein [Roseburia sp. 499]|uniref:hypothetical protein n=1 Tax=Roseburia sp. 499 TaxID=1261634 RepID=UPI0026C7055D